VRLSCERSRNFDRTSPSTTAVRSSNGPARSWTVEGREAQGAPAEHGRGRQNKVAAKVSADDGPATSASRSNYRSVEDRNMPDAKACSRQSFGRQKHRSVIQDTIPDRGQNRFEIYGSTPPDWKVSFEPRPSIASPTTKPRRLQAIVTPAAKGGGRRLRHHVRAMASGERPRNLRHAVNDLHDLRA